jgi:FkbM family methyltransferase
MNYDFIEIGTSDFGTLIQEADNTTVGISIEPIKYYLDRLPNRDRVKKINCAVSLDGKLGRAKLYYIPEVLIKRYDLPFWIRGCNSIGDYHYQHKQLNLQHLVRIIKVDTVPLANILQEHNVEEIKILKIDTEGSDCFILQSFIPALQIRPKLFWPKQIQFESNVLTSKLVVDETIILYTNLGYKVVERGKEDTILLLEASK